MTYTTIENAVVSKFIEKFPELNANRCKPGDVDQVLDALFNEGAKMGCVLEFDGGVQDVNRPFNQQVFTWKIIGIIMIRYTDEVEGDLRSVLDRLPHVFTNDHTLSGVTPLVKLASVSSAEPILVNETPFYWVDFSLEAIER